MSKSTAVSEEVADAPPADDALVQVPVRTLLRAVAKGLYILGKGVALQPDEARALAAFIDDLEAQEEPAATAPPADANDTLYN